MPNRQQELTGLGDEDIYARIEAGPRGRPRLTETGGRAPILSTPAPTLPSEQPTDRSEPLSVHFDPTETDNQFELETSQSLTVESVPDELSLVDDNGEYEPPQYRLVQDDAPESELSRESLLHATYEVTTSIDTDTGGVLSDE